MWYFAYCLSVMAAVTFGCFLSTYILLPQNDPSVQYGVSKQIVKNVRDFTAVRAKNDMGFLKVQLEVRPSTSLQLERETTLSVYGCR
eukprot:UN11567